MIGFEAVKALGFTVVPVPALNVPAVVVEGHGVLLVRYDLDAKERADVVNDILREHGEGSLMAAEDEFAVVRALGIEVIPSTHITRRIVLLADEPVALVRADLDDIDRRAMAEWLLDRTLKRVAGADQ